MNINQIHQVSAILITKEKKYPENVLKHVESFRFGEILIQTECDGLYKRFGRSTKYNDIYVQDDDCMPQIDRIFSEYKGELLTCGMTPHHIAFYANSKICLIGHGAFFPAIRMGVMEEYKNKFGMDNDYRIETDRIFTFLNFPQRRVALSLIQLPVSFNSDRLSLRKEHYSNLYKIEKKLNRFYCFSLSSHNVFYNAIKYTSIILGGLLRRYNIFQVT